MKNVFILALSCLSLFACVSVGVNALDKTLVMHEQEQLRFAQASE